MRQTSQQTPDNLTAIKADASTGADKHILRLAKDLRAKGDPDLPLTFYAEQARQSLQNGGPSTRPMGNPRVNRACGDALYQSWALGKN